MAFFGGQSARPGSAPIVFPDALLTLCPFFSPSQSWTLAGLGLVGVKARLGPDTRIPPDPSSARGGSQPFIPRLNDLPVIPPRQQLLPSLGLTPGWHRLPAVTPLPPPARPLGPAGEGLSLTKLREDFVANKSCIEQPVLESLTSVVRARAGGAAAGQR